MVSDYLKFLDELLMIRASVEVALEKTDVREKTELLVDIKDYVDGLTVEYNNKIEDIEKDMENEAIKTIH